MPPDSANVHRLHSFYDALRVLHSLQAVSVFYLSTALMGGACVAVSRIAAVPHGEKSPDTVISLVRLHFLIRARRTRFLLVVTNKNLTAAEIFPKCRLLRNKFMRSKRFMLSKYAHPLHCLRVNHNLHKRRGLSPAYSPGFTGGIWTDKILCRGQVKR